MMFVWCRGKGRAARVTKLLKLALTEAPSGTGWTCALCATIGTVTACATP